MEGVVTKRPKKEIINNSHNYYEKTGNTKRVVTIKYEYNRTTKQLKYGAAIFKTDAKNPGKYDSKGHLATATARFTTKPVVVEGFEDNGSLKDFHDNLRKQLFSHKVCNRNHPTQD